MDDAVRDALALAQQQSREVFQTIRDQMWTGMSEQDLARITEAELLRRGASRFWAPTLVSFGKNTVTCHPDFPPTSNVLRNFDIVLMDVGPVFGVALGDYCETFVWGSGDVFDEVIADAKALQLYAISRIEPGMAARELYQICAYWIDERGYTLRDLLGNVGHSIDTTFAAHGFIDKYNDSPMIGAWTLEPHIAMGPRASHVEAAKYAARAAGEDLGVFGAKFEDIVFIRESGVELLGYAGK